MSLTFKQREILAKAEERILHRGYEETCLQAGICPKCGEDLQKDPSEVDSSTYYKCVVCRFFMTR